MRKELKLAPYHFSSVSASAKSKAADSLRQRFNVFFFPRIGRIYPEKGRKT
jgi:hypothetical protein